MAHRCRNLEPGASALLAARPVKRPGAHRTEPPGRSEHKKAPMILSVTTAARTGQETVDTNDLYRLLNRLQPRSATRDNYRFHTASWAIRSSADLHDNRIGLHVTQPPPRSYRQTEQEKKKRTIASDSTAMSKTLRPDHSLFCRKFNSNETFKFAEGLLSWKFRHRPLDWSLPTVHAMPTIRPKPNSSRRSVFHHSQSPGWRVTDATEPDVHRKLDGRGADRRTSRESHNVPNNRANRTLRNKHLINRSRPAVP